MGTSQWLPTEANGDIKVSIQDRENPYIQLKLTRNVGTITLSSDAIIDTSTITLSPGHGTVIGNVINLQEGVRAPYQGIALNVVGNVITLDTPLNYSYTTAAAGNRASDNMNVDGSVAPVIFSIAPTDGSWHIVSMLISITDNAAMDDGTFGGIPALTKGCVVRKKDGVYANILNAKTNGDFQLYCDLVTYSEKAPAGSFGVNISDSFYDGHGIVIQLASATGDEFECVIQDNLTGLTSMRIAVAGHVVVS